MADLLTLEGRLDLAAAARLHAELRSCEKGDLTVDLSAVTLLGALCLQCLVAAGRAAQEAGHHLRIVNTPDQVLAQCATMGVSPELIEEGMRHEP